MVGCGLSGLAALVIGGTLLLWATSQWLVLPLRRLSSQVDAIAAATRSTPIVRSQRSARSRTRRRHQGDGHDARADRRPGRAIRAERRLLITSIAHDLRTPLFSLGGYLDAIATGIGDPRERLDQARKKTQQIEALVTGLFDYARAEIDHEPGLQKTRLAGVVADTATAFELEAKERGVTLYVSAHANPIVVIGHDAFERALANVIDNALRHTPPGGTVEVTCGEDVDDGIVCVIDGGRGIAPDLLPHLFEPTARTRNPRYTGEQASDSRSRTVYSDPKAARSTPQTYLHVEQSSRSAYRTWASHAPSSRYPAACPLVGDGRRDRPAPAAPTRRSRPGRH